MRAITPKDPNNTAATCGFVSMYDEAMRSNENPKRQAEVTISPLATAG
jgi:hypothetical protein